MPDRGPEYRPVFSNADVAAAVGLASALTRRFWLALGLTDAGDGVAYSEADREAAQDFADTLARGVPVDLALRLVRTLGQSVVRMAEWQASAMYGHVETRELTPTLEHLLVHAWRRNVASALARIEASEHPELVTGAAGGLEATRMTVGFADLVGFTALSNELDVKAVGDLVEIFEGRCADVIAAHDAQLIKTLGDSVLFVAERPSQGLDIALGLIDLIGRDQRLPDVRIGLATGLIVTRLGDVFGPPVNLAARLTALARRNRVLTDDETVAGLAPASYAWQRLSARPVRGFGLIEPLSVRRI